MYPTIGLLVVSLLRPTTSSCKELYTPSRRSKSQHRDRSDIVLWMASTVHISTPPFDVHNHSGKLILYARRVIWMQLSDRVARGRIRLFSCSRCIDTYIFRKFILVLLEQCTTGRTSGTMHWDLLDIHTLQTLCSGGG